MKVGLTIPITKYPVVVVLQEGAETRLTKKGATELKEKLEEALKQLEEAEK